MTKLRLSIASVRGARAELGHRSARSGLAGIAGARAAQARVLRAQLLPTQSNYSLAVSTKSTLIARMTVTPSSPPSKKQKLSPSPSVVVAPSDILPDEDTAAAPSKAAGAHALPLSSMFSQPAAALVKGKGKESEDEMKEGFETILARLHEGGQSAAQPLPAWIAHATILDTDGLIPDPRRFRPCPSRDLSSLLQFRLRVGDAAGVERVCRRGIAADPISSSQVLLRLENRTGNDHLSTGSIPTLNLSVSLRPNLTFPTRSPPPLAHQSDLRTPPLPCPPPHSLPANRHRGACDSGCATPDPRVRSHAGWSFCDAARQRVPALLLRRRALGL